MLECVANVSEGRDRAAVLALAQSCGAELLDRHTDADHNRSVFTIAGSVATTSQALRRLASAVAAAVDLGVHSGVHPRIGALDVVPFVAWPGTATSTSEAVAAAHEFADWWAGELGVPVFFYGTADPKGRTLPALRREAFEARSPDRGGPAPHSRLGATAVGVRPPMVAVNCRLDRNDVPAARAIAALVRERDGGLAGVRALGFELASQGLAQVSMNLVSLDDTGVEAACGRVRELARVRGLDVVEVELVGLVPRSEEQRWSEEFRTWSGLDTACSVEARLETLG